jgi:hypothetical protein
MRGKSSSIWSRYRKIVASFVRCIVNIAAADKRRGRHVVAIERSAVLKIFCCSPTIIPVMDDN